MFSGASNLADGVDKAFAVIFGISIFLLILITAVMVWSLFRFNKKRHKEAMQFSGSVKLEITWIVIPFIIVLIMFYYGWQGFKPMRNVPKDAMEINAIGRMWEFEFNYGNGKISKDTLVLPLNKAIKLNLISEDVNHSLFIPAFRLKEDMVPGYDNYMWFIPTKEGTFDILCAEYCGLLHSGMLGKAVVKAEPDYDNWLANLTITDRNAEPEGLTILKDNSCLSCHSLDGSKLIGPSFKGLYGSERTVVTENGETTTITAMEEYVKSSIYEPNKEVVKGFNKGLMQSYIDVVSEEEVDKISEYLKTIGVDE